MTIIASFISQKGGVGKTTLAVGLAALAAEKGWDAKIADLDSGQASSALTHWLRLQKEKEAAETAAFKKRKAPDPRPSFAVEVFKIQDFRKALAQAENFHLFVIDGPAKMSAASLEIAKASDIVIQPVSVAMIDLVPAVAEFKALEEGGIPANRLVIALNKVKTDAHEERARRWLANYPQYHVWGNALRDKAGYVDAMNDGLAITETSKKSLKAEAVAAIESLMAVVMGRQAAAEAAE